VRVCTCQSAFIAFSYSKTHIPLDLCITVTLSKLSWYSRGSQNQFPWFPDLAGNFQQLTYIPSSYIAHVAVQLSPQQLRASSEPVQNICIMSVVSGRELWWGIECHTAWGLIKWEQVELEAWAGLLEWCWSMKGYSSATGRLSVGVCSYVLGLYLLLVTYFCLRDLDGQIFLGRSKVNLELTTQPW